MNLTRTIAAFFVAVWLFAPLSARACPLCSEAIANANASSADDDVDQFPAAMNSSILMMLAVPYTALGIVGFCIYRGVKQNDAYRKAQSDPEA